MNYLFIFLSTFTIFISSAWASYDKAPPSFAYNGARAVFVSFEDANYKLTYDFLKKQATVETTIHFKVIEPGYPIFDLVPEPFNVTLDGKVVQAPLIGDPDAQTKFRTINRKLSRGSYELKLKNLISENLVFNNSGIASAFWLGDLSDRKYLENYIPSNLEFDHYPKRFHVKLIGTNNLPHTIKANGQVEKINNSEFKITFPAIYTSSSVFFHLYPTRTITRNVSFYYTSIDGRKLPVDIYSVVEIDQFVSQTKTILAELESDYGPFPYNQVLIYGTSLRKGGMEYSGATATGLLSLGHELFHSYNARGVMPVNGNAGWMDEGMSTWRGDLYPQLASLDFDTAKISGHSPWRRSTDRDSYVQGSAFLAHISHKMNMRGLDLKNFFKGYFKRHMYSSVTTEMFEKELNEYARMDFSEEFDRFIYGKYSVEETVKVTHPADPNHPEYTRDELLEMTMPQ